MDDLRSSREASMARRLPPLSALRTFEAAARRGSFLRAAEELGVTPTAVSHQVRQLEQWLGTPLFRRAPRKVTLTDAGSTLAPALTRALDGMAEAVEAMSKRPARKVATLSATVAFTGRVLVPKAARFRELNPGWDLRLHASDDAVDLHAGEADAAIRYGLARPADLTGLPLMTDRFAPVASPALGLESHEDLRRATLLHFDWRNNAGATVPNWRGWAEAAGLEGFDAGSGVTFNDENSAILAAIAGQGAALLSIALVAAELASGALVQPFGPVLEGWRYDFVHPAGAEDRPAVAALRRWVEVEIAPAAARAPAPI
ncbi:LysR family transcriptional regulator [Hansschlegelia zhihuaiae]|uniref:LysR family transcriptional regulator n=2 Tax=Hansschlegelia zhihuaiae TaxID=405005 RepID=A0A4Q0MK04_9HYPH|nr:LysR family transcriptional regulator [Hansschlegelia zhihuaiae]